MRRPWQEKSRASAARVRRPARARHAEVASVREPSAPSDRHATVLQPVLDELAELERGVTRRSVLPHGGAAQVADLAGRLDLVLSVRARAQDIEARLDRQQLAAQSARRRERQAAIRGWLGIAWLVLAVAMTTKLALTGQADLLPLLRLLR